MVMQGTHTSTVSEPHNCRDVAERKADAKRGGWQAAMKDGQHDWLVPASIGIGQATLGVTGDKATRMVVNKKFYTSSKSLVPS